MTTAMASSSFQKISWVSTCAPSTPVSPPSGRGAVRSRPRPRSQSMAATAPPMATAYTPKMLRCEVLAKPVLSGALIAAAPVAGVRWTGCRPQRAPRGSGMVPPCDRSGSPAVAGGDGLRSTWEDRARCRAAGSGSSGAAPVVPTDPVGWVEGCATTCAASTATRRSRSSAAGSCSSLLISSAHAREVDGPRRVVVDPGRRLGPADRCQLADGDRADHPSGDEGDGGERDEGDHQQDEPDRATGRLAPCGGGYPSPGRPEPEGSDALDDDRRGHAAAGAHRDEGELAVSCARARRARCR